jgi:hypothetical protein
VNEILLAFMVGVAVLLTPKRRSRTRRGCGACRVRISLPRDVR